MNPSNWLVFLVALVGIVCFLYAVFGKKVDSEKATILAMGGALLLVSSLALVGHL